MASPCVLYDEVVEMRGKRFAWLGMGFALLFVALFTIKAPVAHACSCAMPPTVEKELERKSAIFKGKVTQITVPETGELISTADLVAITFQVDQVWKGALAEETTIYTARDSVSCGYEGFQENKEYVVFAYESENKLQTGVCELTKPASSAGEELDALGKGYAPTAVTVKNKVTQLSGEGASEQEVPEKGNSNVYLIAGACFAVLMLGGVVLVVRKSRSGK